MNKYICLTMCAQTLVAPLSRALYTIDKTPQEGTNYYKVKYMLDEERGFCKENGLLKEVITKAPVDPNQPLQTNYAITYIYHNHKVRLNNFILNLSDHKGEESRVVRGESRFLVDKNYKIINIENWHPVVFYLNNLRSGIISEFDKIGQTSVVSLKDNHHTYQETCDSTIEFTKLSEIQVEYKVDAIQSDTDDDNQHIPIYTFRWNALASLLKGRGYTQRRGKIQVDDKVNIKRLSVYTPQRLSGFYVSSIFKEKQAGWLNIISIGQEEFKKLYSENQTIRKYFDPNFDSKKKTELDSADQITSELETKIELDPANQTASELETEESTDQTDSESETETDSESEEEVSLRGHLKNFFDAFGKKF